MAISHADHNHPNTPAARAKCRKEMATHGAPLTTGPNVTIDRVSGTKTVSKPATWNVKPKGKKPVALKNVKRTNTLIKNISDLADVPHGLVYGITEAWARDLDVRVGDRFRDDEARITIQADLCEIAMVWKVTNPHGVSAIWVRNWDSSKQFKVDSIAEAFTVAETREVWDEFGNLCTA